MVDGENKEEEEAEEEAAKEAKQRREKTRKKLGGWGFGLTSLSLCASSPLNPSTLLTAGWVPSERLTHRF